MSDVPSAPCELLTWDSEFFGRKIGSVNGHTLDAARMGEILRWAEEVDVDCLYFLADTHDPLTIRLAEQNGFLFQSVRTVIERSLLSLDAITLPPMDSLRMRLGGVGDIERLRPIARTAYTWTRFYTDPCFPREKCAEMYDVWLTKSLQGTMADGVIVAEYEGVPVGYVTCRLGRDGAREGTFQLLGVNEAHRGVKIGQRAIVEAMRWMAAHGMETGSLVTQGHNVAVIRFYERLGFVTRQVQFWYHRWFHGCDADEG